MPDQHLFTANSVAAGATSIPLHHFLRSMAPIIARNPDVFLEAVRATCSIEEITAPGASRVLVVLKKGKVGLAVTMSCGLLVSTDQVQCGVLTTGYIWWSWGCWSIQLEWSSQFAESRHFQGCH